MPLRNTFKDYSIENIINAGHTIKDFDFFAFEYFVDNIAHLRKSHRHSFYAIIVCQDGKGVHTIDFRDFHLKARRIFLINYGQVHSWKWTKDVKGFVVLFTKSFYNIIFTGNDKIKSDTALNGLQPFIDAKPNEFREWEYTLRLIEQEFLAGRENSSEIICLLLKSCVLRYGRATQLHHYQNNKGDRKQNILFDFKGLIEGHFTHWKVPKEYALALNITPNYLNSIVKQISGMNAGEHIRQRVLLEAKRLLTHTDLTVTQISYELGFNDKSHFGKYFKKAENITPDGYRRNFLKKAN